MKTNSYDLVEDENASTFSLLLIILILATIIIGGYLAYNWVQDGGGSSPVAENAGSSVWGALAGALSGFFKGAWNTGTSAGSKYNYGSWINRRAKTFVDFYKGLF